MCGIVGILTDSPRFRDAARIVRSMDDAIEHRGPDASAIWLGDGVAWFRMHDQVIEGAGPMSSILGPADWTHGIARPVQNVVADPNPNLTVQLFRQPRGLWIGVRAEARWTPSAGFGAGSGTLLDVEGEIGRVSMSVVLVPLPRPAMAAG